MLKQVPLLRFAILCGDSAPSGSRDIAGGSRDQSRDDSTSLVDRRDRDRILSA